MKFPIFYFVIGALLVESINLMAAKDYDNGVPLMGGVFLLCLAAALFEAWGMGKR